MGINWMGLTTGVSALRTFQQSLGVVQHNIANADTEGYTRQIANLAQVAPADYAPYGGVGRGVEISSITQARNIFIDANIRRENQTQGSWDAKEKIYTQLQTVLGDVGETGFSSVMSQFWGSWQALANNPSSVSLRSAVREDAAAMTNSFNQIDTRLKSLQADINDQVKSDVNTINSYATQIVSLNQQIRSIAYQGISPNDLLDQRNLLLDKMNTILPVTTSNNNDGSINVYINGQGLVMNTTVHAIEAVPRVGDTAQLVDVKWKESGMAVTTSDGQLSGLIEMRDSVIPAYIGQMNTMASSIITKVNAVHSTGMGLDGTTKITGALDFTGTFTSNGSFSLNGHYINVFSGDDLNTVVYCINIEETNSGVHAEQSGNRLVLTPSTTNPQTIKIDADPDGVMKKLGIISDFFTGTSAKDMSIAPAIKNDLNKIATSQSGAPGDNTIAYAIGNLKDVSTMLDGTATFDGYYNSFLANLGVKTQEATQANTNQATVLAQLEEMRQSISGVSVDEELAKMLEYQRGYEAAAKYIKVVDGLLDTLINGIK